VGTDNETPAASLTYQLRIGTTPGGSDVLAPMSSGNGQRRLPQMGNAQLGIHFPFSYKAGMPYYWSVQTIDGVFAGSSFAPQHSFRIIDSPPTVVSVGVSNLVSGDLSGDGIVDENELNTVLSNYWPSSPWLYLTNVAGLGGTTGTFALTNSTSGAFSVEYSTNLTDWFFLGPATPRYGFTDTNAPAQPQRYYRLRWP
jgi:hypothetical protein